MQAEDRVLANAVLVSVRRHLWYLTEEFVVFALADRDVSDEIKSRMVTDMLAAGRPEQFRAGKPNFNIELLEGKHPDDIQLYKFAGERSWLVFHLLNLDDTAWMQLAPDQWENQESYIRFKDCISSLEVVNDSAERAVKDVIHFASYSHDPTRREDVIRVVNSHRELIDFKHLTKEQMAFI